MDIIAFLGANKVVIVTFLLALSEVLALIPSLKSNSIFEVVVSFLHSLIPKNSGY